jgi:hypothetical protein
MLWARINPVPSTAFVIMGLAGRFPAKPMITAPLAVLGRSAGGVVAGLGVGEAGEGLQVG